MNAIVREYKKEDVPAMRAIWNEVVAEGVAFPQMEELTQRQAEDFFANQSRCGVAEEPETGRVVGLYILHPNNVGRCGHIANASYAVAGNARGLGAGQALVRHSLQIAARLDFRVMQFNAVVAENLRARRLYERLGFRQLGVIPGGFLTKDGRYVDICPYYKELL